MHKVDARCLGGDHVRGMQVRTINSCRNGRLYLEYHWGCTDVKEAHPKHTIFYHYLQNKYER